MCSVMLALQWSPVCYHFSVHAFRLCFPDTQYKLYVALGNCVIQMDPQPQDRLPLLKTVGCCVYECVCVCVCVCVCCVCSVRVGSLPSLV